MNFFIGGIKFLEKESHRGICERIKKDDGHKVMKDFRVDCFTEVVKEEVLNPFHNQA